VTSDRRRTRRGLHASLAGDPADEVLEGLVAQFSDPYTFIRELIQNSLDAGSSQIDVHMERKDGELHITVRDDGEGMDQEIIEGYLLTLFRSTKDEDLTKIGKFGIGFVSLFAMRPREVVVDTGRDGVWHRVVFAADRSYTLIRMPDPYEGTSVVLKLPRGAAAAASDCQRVHESATRWCRFAEADITTRAEGVAGGWGATSLRRPFVVDAPLAVEDRGDGFLVALGPSSSERPAVGFYNRGLTLWEAEEALVPGVTFRVRARHLEHTLTRDNVMRDRHFEEVVARVHRLAREQLGVALERELAAAARTGDLDTTRRLCASVGPRHPWSWSRDVGLFPAIGRAPVTIDEVSAERAGLFGRFRGREATVLWAPADHPLGACAARDGRLVLVADAAEDAHLALARRFTTKDPEHVERRLWAPRRVEPDAPCGALLAAAAPQRLVAADFRGAGAALQGRFAVAQAVAFAVEEAPPGPPSPSWPLLVDVTHPLFVALCRLPPALAAPLCVRAARIGAGFSEPLDGALLAAAARALPSDGSADGTTSVGS
jgi:hypothetical protein